MRAETIEISDYNVLDLFASADSSEEQNNRIYEFLDCKDREGAKCLFVYYVGHGGFLENQDYFLSVFTTQKDRRHISGMRFDAIAQTIQKVAGSLKTYIILDCCYAANALKSFQSDKISDLIDVKAAQLLPASGTAILAASSKSEAARSDGENSHTMFAEALSKTLEEGSMTAGEYMSIRDVSEEVARRINFSYGMDGVRPEVHTPQQNNSDIADMYLFKNPCYDKAKNHDKEKYYSEVYHSNKRISFALWRNIPAYLPPGVRHPCDIVQIKGKDNWRVSVKTNVEAGGLLKITHKKGFVRFSYNIVINSGKNIFFGLSSTKTEKVGEIGGRLYRYADTKGESKRHDERIFLMKGIINDNNWHEGKIYFDFSDEKEHQLMYLIFMANSRYLADRGSAEFILSDVVVFAEN